jgi:hypothetical protein
MLLDEEEPLLVEPFEPEELVEPPLDELEELCPPLL